VGGPKTLPQLLIANYGITQKSLGPFELDELDAVVELAPGRCRRPRLGAARGEGARR
jgi:hypothetical protein